VTGDNRYALALDFGGTKLAAGVVDLRDMRVIDSAFQATRREAGADGVVSDMMAMAANLSQVDQIRQIGISYGGYAANNQILKSLHVKGWDHYPIREKLRERFGEVDVFVANDANAVGLSEFKFGAGKGTRSMLFVTVSTGVGGGIIHDGKLLEGTNGIAGEIGHTKAIPQNGPLCDCGQRGCVEAVSSGPSMARQAQILMRKHDYIETALRQVENLTAREIADYAQQGDALATRVLQEGALYLGIAIGNAINLLDLECVVIGGGVSRSGKIWWDAVEAAVLNTVLPWRPPVLLKPSALGTHEGIWGAVALLPTLESADSSGDSLAARLTENDL
jgi:glucokinase